MHISTAVTHTQSTSTQQQMTKNTPLESAVKRVEKAEFIAQFLEAYTTDSSRTLQEKSIMAGDLWDRIFCIGGETNALLDSSYPYQYLSDTSCDQVIERCGEFGSGLDYKNLPQNFFPVQDQEDPKGPLTVIHFQMSDKAPSPWAVLHTDKDDDAYSKHFIDTDHKTFFYALWGQANETCSEKNLYEVSTKFYNELQKRYTKITDVESRDGEEPLRELPMLLQIFASQFERLQQEESGQWYYNPVVWLSRVANVLLNPRLADKNILFQIEEVSEMNLATPFGINKTINALYYNGIIPACITRNCEHETWGVSTFLEKEQGAWQIKPISPLQPQPIYAANTFPHSEEKRWILVPSTTGSTNRSQASETPLPIQEADLATFFYNYLSLQSRAPAMPVVRSMLKAIYAHYGYAAEDKEHYSLFRGQGVDQVRFMFDLLKAVITCSTQQNYLSAQEPYYHDAIRKLLTSCDNYIVQFHTNIIKQPSHPLVDWAKIIRWSSLYTNSPLSTFMMGALNRVVGKDKLEETNLLSSALVYMELFGDKLATKDMRNQDETLYDMAGTVYKQALNKGKSIAASHALGTDFASLASGDAETSDHDIKKFQQQIKRLNDLLITANFGLAIAVDHDNITLADPRSNSATKAADGENSYSRFDNFEDHRLFDKTREMIEKWNRWSDKKYDIGTGKNVDIHVAFAFLLNTTGEAVLQLVKAHTNKASSYNRFGYMRNGESSPVDFINCYSIPKAGRYFSRISEQDALYLCAPLPKDQEQFMDRNWKFFYEMPFFDWQDVKKGKKLQKDFVEGVNKQLKEARELFNKLANCQFLLGVYERFPRGSYQCVEGMQDPHWKKITTQRSKIGLVTGGAKSEDPQQDQAWEKLFNVDPEELTIGFNGRPIERPKAVKKEGAEFPVMVSQDRIQDMHILPVLSEKLDKLSHVRQHIDSHLANMTGTSSLEALLDFLDNLADKALNNNTRESRISILTEMKERFSRHFPDRYFDQAIEDEKSAELTSVQQQRLKTIMSDEGEYDIIYALLKQIHGYEKHANNTQCLSPDFYDELLTELRIIAQNSTIALKMTCKSIKYFECSQTMAREICQHIIQFHSMEKAQQVQTNAQDHLGLPPSEQSASIILSHLQLVNNEDMKDIIGSFSSTFIAEECIARLLLIGADSTMIGFIMKNMAQIRQYFPCTEHHLLSLAETAFKAEVHASFDALHVIAGHLQGDLHATKRMFSILSYTQKQPKLLLSFQRCIGLEWIDANLIGYMDYLLRSNQDPVIAINALATVVQAANHQASILKTLQTLLQSPPYPTVEQLKLIIADANAIKAFKQTPYPRTAGHQYKAIECEQLKNQFTGVESSLFEGEAWQNFTQMLVANRSNSPSELQKLLDGSNTDKLAYIIEQLARTAYQVTDDGQAVAQELNTTQVMTLYAFIHQSEEQRNIMAQISTGEGKSRIAIVYLAWQVLVHNRTIDLLTSNSALSARDFLAYSDFLTSLRIQSGLINMASSPEEYVDRGINFSDNHSLFLKRLMGDFTQENTLLFIDEADTLLIDGCVHPYQIGEADNRSLLLPKLYEMVFQYYKVHGEASTVDGLKQDIQANITGLNPLIKAMMKSITEHKLKSLLQSCAQAYQMTCGNEYVVSKDKQIVQTPAGQQRQHTILATRKGRILYGVIYEKGLHAFLALKERSITKLDIYIQPETTTTNNAFLVNMIQHYDRTFGITGTTDLERFTGLQHHGVSYLKIPELRENKRVIYRPIWTATPLDQLRQVQDVVTKHPNCPILIFTKDDQALELFATLLKTAHPERQLNAIDAHASAEREIAAIEVAGKNNNITLSTAGRLGRGTDIKNPEGNLLVITTYLEDPRTKVQNEARTGRYGKSGTVQPVYNLMEYQLTASNQNLTTLSQLREYEAQDQALTNKACDLFGLIREQLLQRIPAATRSDYWQYTTHEANRYYDFIKRLKDTPALEQFIDALESEIETALKISYELDTVSVCVNQDIQQAFDNMLEFRSIADRALATEEKLADAYQRGDDGQKVVYASGSIWWEKVQATFRGKRRPFADLIEWAKGTGHAYPHGIPVWLITLWVVIPVAALIATAYVWQPVWTMAIALQALAWVKGTALPVTMHFFATPLGLGIAGLVVFVALSLVIAYNCQKPVQVNRFEQNLVTAKELQQDGLSHTNANTQVSNDLGKKSKYLPQQLP